MGIAGTILIHVVALILLKCSELPESTVVNRVMIDFAEEEIPPEEQNQNDQQEQLLDENGQPLENVAANMNAETQKSSRLDRGNLDEEVDREIRELEKQWENDANLSDEARRKLEENREKRNQNKELYDENAEDVDAERGKGGNVAVGWSLEGRKNYDLPKPSYVCKASGEVHVLIKVNQHGEVTWTSIDESQTNTNNECLRDNAIKYAKRARFNDDYSPTATSKGWIHFKYARQ